MVLSVVGVIVHSVPSGVSESDWEPLGDAPELVSGICISCLLFEVVRYQRHKNLTPSPSKKRRNDILVGLNVNTNSVIRLKEVN